MSHGSVGLPGSVLVGVLIVLLGCTDAAIEYSPTSQASLASVESNPLSDVGPSSGMPGRGMGSATSQLSSTSSTLKPGNRDEARPVPYSVPPKAAADAVGRLCRDTRAES